MQQIPEDRRPFAFQQVTRHAPAPAEQTNWSSLRPSQNARRLYRHFGVKRPAANLRQYAYLRHAHAGKIKNGGGK